jgi:hypothetical protein
MSVKDATKPWLNSKLMPCRFMRSETICSIKTIAFTDEVCPWTKKLWKWSYENGWVKCILGKLSDWQLFYFAISFQFSWASYSWQSTIQCIIHSPTFSNLTRFYVNQMIFLPQSCSCKPFPGVAANFW